MKVRCYKLGCRHNVNGHCSIPEITIDELGICINDRETTQYPQERLKKKSKVTSKA